MRALPIRTLAVFGIGAAVLVGILYYASTVDGRAPAVQDISLTQHLTGDLKVALTTSSIEVSFSEPVEHRGAEKAFAISPVVDGSFSWTAARLTFTPAARLPLRTAFEVSIRRGVRDPAGNEMTTGPPAFGFMTVGNPSVVASDPADADAEVALGAPIVVDFSTLMDTASVERALHLVPAIGVRVRWSRERLTIVPIAPLEPNRRYALTIGVGARDQAGTPLEVPFRLSFLTAPSGLTVRAIAPADGVSGIAITSSIAVVFDRALDPASVRDDLFTITPAVAGSLDAISSPAAAGLLDAARRVLRFQPSGPLDPNTTYDVALAPGLLGADGTGLPAGLSWSFTTGSPTTTLSNQVVFISDRGGIANLWGMNPDGTNQRQLSTELSAVTDYAVSPDGHSFVVGDGAVIVSQRADGTARRLLTEANVVEFDAAYSPDGTMITFSRADLALGGSLGIWTRRADGSDPHRIDLPVDESATPSPDLPGPLSVLVRLLRAPRISPDATAVAFIDEVGGVAIWDLEQQKLTTGHFVSFSEPIWLPDSSGVLVSGLATGSGIEPPGYRRGSPVPLLDPVSLGADAAQAAALRVVRLDRRASSVTVTAAGAGAARPTIDAGGRLAFIRLAPPNVTTGDVWVTSALDDAGTRVLRDSRALAGSASFAPKPNVIVISRIPALGDDQATGGVWLLNLRGGDPQRLSNDGWLPRWLP